MSDESKAPDPGAVWREQPQEKAEVRAERMASHRALELYSSTRGEILASIGAVVVLVAVIAWRLEPLRERIPIYWLAAVAAWVAISAYWFRDRIGHRDAPRPDALAATGAEFYRRGLERRRDHLRNEWIWHGPMVLACVILAAVLIGKSFGGVERVESVVPLLILLAAWTGYGLRRRWREARQLQREIEELQRLSI